jgi:DNA-binding FadR family transcriptional regulator
MFLSTWERAAITMAMSPSDVPQGTRRPSAVEQVVNSLFSGLMSNRFAPGQRLIEVDLTAEYGVSRGTLREAFRRLAADGLIEIVPHRGAIVRRLSPPAGPPSPARPGLPVRGRCASKSPDTSVRA